jgi:heme exporter protein B
MFGILLKKEFLVELKSKEISTSMLTFGVVVILIFAFSFNVSPKVMTTFAPGLFWVMTLFISTLGLHRMYAYEKEFDAFGFLISAPVDRGLIFLAKWISGTLYSLIADLFILPPFILFLQLQIDIHLGLAVLILVCGNLGLMVLGSLVSGLAMRAKMSEVLLPILLFPLASRL